ncbi:SLC13 family permease [Bacillus tuaregi]|uniref:SLC13 family permease n=1 Tax=Bacillus tuaregi TaxID=1816695 RepID=UPI0008F94E47|nr:SLC13 family permease [Bacillus tuaregi]
MQLILTFIILACTIFLFMSNIIRADLVSILALLALVLTGILEPAEALSGFSNSVVIMIAALFVVGAGIRRTGLARKAGDLLLHWSGNSEKKLFIFLLIIVLFVGSFMSNTGTVAIMLPVVISIAISIKRDVSKLLIPLSYTASLSGLMTLIASPPNLIVSQVLSDHGFERLGFFDMTPIGVVAAITGILYLFLVRNILLPNNQSKNQVENHEITPKELILNYGLEDNLHRVQVLENSPVVDKPLSELKIPSKYHLAILKIDRKIAEGRRLLPITYQEMAGPGSVVQAKDILYIQGSRTQVEKLVEDYQLIMETEKSRDDVLVSSKMGIAEVLLTPDSRLINKTIREIHFRKKYNVNVIAINRKGQYLLREMSKIKLRFGDALLVQGTWEEMEYLAKETKDVVVVGQPKELASQAAASGKAPIAGMILLLMVALMVFEVFPAVISVLIGASLMLVTGCLRNMDDAYSQMNWESIVLIACMLPLATALEKTGGMVFLSEGIIELLGGFGTIGVLAGIYFLTMVFGQFISNTATAVLFAPIGINAAINLGVSPYPFLIAVAVGASMAFATPVATPTNALVMTAGGYKFMDFVKIGVPLQLIMFVVMMIAIPILFSL